MTNRKLGQTIAPPRFLLFLAVFVGVGVFALTRLPWPVATMIGFDAAAATFLVVLFPLFGAKTTDQMRQYAIENDANRVVLLGISMVLTAVVMTAVFFEISAKGAPNVALVIVTLALGWLFGNMVYALHYAHVYYMEGSKGGLDFSGAPDVPDYWDFVYFSFTLGMTFQTSDTSVTTRGMRQLVTIHSLIAFFFNIGILAFSINTLGGKS